MSTTEQALSDVLRQAARQVIEASNFFKYEDRRQYVKALVLADTNHDRIVSSEELLTAMFKKDGMLTPAPIRKGISDIKCTDQNSSLIERIARANGFNAQRTLETLKTPDGRINERAKRFASELSAGVIRSVLPTDTKSAMIGSAKQELEEAFERTVLMTDKQFKAAFKELKLGGEISNLPDQVQPIQTKDLCKRLGVKEI